MRKTYFRRKKTLPIKKGNRISPRCFNNNFYFIPAKAGIFLLFPDSFFLPPLQEGRTIADAFEMFVPGSPLLLSRRAIPTWSFWMGAEDGVVI